MKRSLLFLLLTQFLIGGVCAQGLIRSASTTKPEIYPSAVASSTQAKTLGYADPTTKGFTGVGLAFDSDFILAMVIPADQISDFVGGKLTKVFIGVDNEVTNTQLYIAKTKGGTPLYTQDITLKSGGWNEIVLDEPFTIEDDNLAICYKGTAVARTQFGVVSGSEGTNNCWIAYRNAGSTSMYSWANLSSHNSNTAILGSVERDDYTTCNVDFTSMSVPSLQKTNTGFSIKGTVYNTAATTINSFDVVYKVGDNDPITVPVENINVYNRFAKDFVIDNVTVAEESTLPIEVTISNINGGVKEDDITDNTLANEIRFGDFYNKRVLLEHFTTSPCPNCYPAHLKWESVLETRPNVIMVAHHSGYQSDEMTIDAHNSYLWFYNSPAVYAPASMLDRTNLSSLGAINSSNKPAEGPVFAVRTLEQLALFTDSLSDNYAFASVNIDKNYNPANRKLNVTVSGESRFVSEINKDLNLTVYLVEDSIKGTQSGVSGAYYHNHVVRAVLSGVWGDAVSFDGDTYSATYSFNIPANMDVNQMSIAAFLSAYDSEPNGCKVYNAESVYIEEKMSISDPQVDEKTAYVHAEGSSIVIDGEFTSAQIYDAMGRLIKSINNTTNSVSANSGLYIVKVTNGNKQFTEKVIVR
ncbi:hypothetical protein M2132_001772 [Dysgonomonas sp. PH5-45]|uniref:Omp28-related outer membrane protein n=1 Tax=unclassified Dysgonomonas TaxID=2630389 RepID=UPI002475EB53|nr:MULTISPECIES: Omp28-related outer membrane protein [unclassified Dysgonomonas]MDH6355430.1 hypothetical protein [Dysgonomonas sp. PH5-45]MDH6388327.1 hypothetical protein [Dysgonomonas sp. PH5-37]